MAQLKDTVVSGSLRATDSLLTTTLQTQILKLPTASNGTTYGPGTSGHIIFSNGSSAYWGATTGITALGTITTGTWNATKINPNKGGTGVDSYAKGDILYAGAAIANTATTALSKLALGTAGYTLQATANGPAWTQTVAVANGGTGKTSWTQWGVLYASASTTLANTGAGTAGYLLQSNASSAPSWIQATNANTASTIVKRDASGNFSAGTITASLTGHASLDLPLSGGTMTGNLLYKLSSVDASKTNNNISSSLYPTTFCVVDNADRILCRLEGVIQSNGAVRSYWYVRNYNTSGAQTAQKGIYMEVANNGTMTYNVSDASAFRSALGLTSMATATAANYATLQRSSTTDGQLLGFYGSSTTHHSNQSSYDNHGFVLMTTTTGLFLWDSTASSTVWTSAQWVRTDGSSTMSGSLNISKAGECGTEVNNTSQSHKVAFIVGSSGNGGIFDRTNSKWIVYSTAAGAVTLNGNASTATSLQCGVTTNDIGNYGNVKVTTARGSYQGIFIGPSAANGFCLMNHNGGDYMGMYKGANPGAAWVYCYRPSLGKLGIMTSSPTETLHIAGNLIVAGTGSAREYLYIRSSGDYEADLIMGRQGANKWAFSVRKSSEAFFGLWNYNLTTPGWAFKVDDSTSNITTYGTYIKVYGSGDRYVEAVNTTTSCRICLDSGTTNHGIWSSGYWNGSAYTNSNLYMIYRNSSNQIVINHTHAVVEQQSVSYIAGAKGDVAGLLAKKTEGATAWYPAVCIQTKAAGSWQIGTYTSESLEFVYAAKADITNQTNDNAKHWYLTADSYGTILTTRNYSSYALPLSGGIMTGAIQFNSKGACSIYNGPNDAGNGYNGALNNLVISSWYGVSFTTSCTGQTCTGKNAFSINCRNGYAYAGRMYNAVWNDYAEFRRGDSIEPGRCMIETSSGIMTLSNKRLQPGAKIISDTYGYSMGETEETKTPIAVSGRVLAYPYRAKKEYSLGAAVCSAPNGTVDLMTRDEIMMYPERIVGTVSEIPTYEIWHGGNGDTDIMVNGRIWIYVR